MDICKEVGNKIAWEIASWEWKRESLLQELAGGEELTKEVTRRGYWSQRVQLSSTHLGTNLAWQF